jgi:hypothetical protein
MLVSGTKHRQLLNQLDNFRNENQRLLVSNTSQSEELRQITAKSAELSLHNSELGNELSRLLNEHETLQASNTKQSLELEELKKQISDLRKEHETLVRSNANQSQELKDENAKNLKLADEVLSLRINQEIQRRNWNDEKSNLLGHNETFQRETVTRQQELETERTRSAELEMEVMRLTAILQDPVEMLKLSGPYKDMEEKNKVSTRLNDTLKHALINRDLRIESISNDLSAKDGQLTDITNSFQQKELEIATLESRLSRLATNSDNECQTLVSKVTAFASIVSSWITANTPTDGWKEVGNPAIIEIITVLQRQGLVTPESPPCLLLPDQLRYALDIPHSRTVICRHIITSLLFHKILQPSVCGLEEQYSTQVDGIEQSMLKGSIRIPLD